MAFPSPGAGRIFRRDFVRPARDAACFGAELDSGPDGRGKQSRPADRVARGSAKSPRSLAGRHQTRCADRNTSDDRQDPGDATRPVSGAKPDASAGRRGIWRGGALAGLAGARRDVGPNRDERARGHEISADLALARQDRAGSSGGGSAVRPALATRDGCGRGIRRGISRAPGDAPSLLRTRGARSTQGRADRARRISRGRPRGPAAPSSHGPTVEVLRAAAGRRGPTRPRNHAGRRLCRRWQSSPRHQNRIRTRRARRDPCSGGRLRDLPGCDEFGAGARQQPGPGGEPLRPARRNRRRHRNLAAPHRRRHCVRAGSRQYRAGAGPIPVCLPGFGQGGRPRPASSARRHDVALPACGRFVHSRA